MKMFKKFNLLLFGIISSFILTNNINAAETEKICTEHKNYYFLSTIQTKEDFDKSVAQEGGFAYYTGTTAPALNITGLDISTKSEHLPKLEKICLVRDKNDLSPCETSSFIGTPGIDYEVMDLTTYYTYYLATMNNGTKYTYEDTKSEQESKQTSAQIYTVPNNETIRYISHGKWYELNDDNSIKTEYDQNNNIVKNNTVEEMVAAAALPTELSIPNDDQRNIINSPIEVSIKRKIMPTDFGNDKLQPFKALWQAVNETEESEIILSPSIYKVTYYACENKTLYTAKIKYVYADTKKEIEGVNQYNKVNLENGHSENVTSPPVKNCSPNKAAVNYTINNADFETTVEYTCNITTNPKTGNTLVIGAVLIITIASIAYIVYYTKKKNKEEI